MGWRKPTFSPLRVRVPSFRLPPPSQTVSVTTSITMTMMTEVILYLSLFSLFVSPISAIPDPSRTHLGARNEFVNGYPADPQPSPAPANATPASYNISVPPSPPVYKLTAGHHRRFRRYPDMRPGLGLLSLPPKTKIRTINPNNSLSSRWRNVRKHRRHTARSGRRPRKTKSSSMARRARAQRCARVYV